MIKNRLMALALLSVGIFALTNCKSEAPPVKEEATPVEDKTPAKVEIDLVELQEQKKMPAAVQVDIEFDHFFKTAKAYQAYPLTDILKPYLQETGIDPNSDAVVTFFCVDGYKPTQKLKELMAAEGFIAFRDEALEDPNQSWADSIKGKFQPFYLVWKNVPYEDDHLTWPYGLFRLEVNPVDTVYDAITPRNNDLALAGFGHFKHHCIKCHSINKIGGNLGPEFNFPKNITDYWEIENIWAFAKNPQSFRYNAKMAPIENLTRSEFDEIIAFLKYIKTIKPTESDI